MVGKSRAGHRGIGARKGPESRASSYVSEQHFDDQLFDVVSKQREMSGRRGRRWKRTQLSKMI